MWTDITSSLLLGEPLLSHLLRLGCSRLLTYRELIFFSRTVEIFFFSELIRQDPDITEDILEKSSETLKVKMELQSFVFLSLLHFEWKIGLFTGGSGPFASSSDNDCFLCLQQQSCIFHSIPDVLLHEVAHLF